MPLVRELLITLRTLMEDDPQPPKYRRRRHNSNGKSNRHKQTTALVLTFRDLFRPGGLNVVLDEIDTNRRPTRKHDSPTSCSIDASVCEPEIAVPVIVPSTNIHDQRLVCFEQNTTNMTSPNRLIYQDEATPLLCEETAPIVCTELVPRPLPLYSGNVFSHFALVRRMKKKPETLTVTLNPEDENKTVSTLRKVANWSPRKQNSTTFQVSLPANEKHSALAVVENAVNMVKEEQLKRKKKKRFLWLRFC